MIPLRRVAAATDFSVPGSQAIARAARLALEHASALQLIHVVPDAAFEALGTAALDRLSGTRFSSESLAEEAYERLSRIAGEIGDLHGIDCTACIASGRPAQCIAAIAEEGADLVVLGARGEHSTWRSLVGTTSQRLVSISPCPALLVRRAPDSPYARVLAPVDFSAASLAALRVSAAWLPAAQIKVAHAFEHPYEAMMRYAGVDDRLIERYASRKSTTLHKALRSWAGAVEAAETPFSFGVEHGHANTVIDSLIVELGADLVALAARGKPDLEKAVLGSVTLHTALTSPCDVLVFTGQRFAEQIEDARDLAEVPESA